MRLTIPTLIASFILICSSISVYAKVDAASQKQLWDRAKEAYNAHEYDRSILNYNQLIEGGVQSDAVFYNLGNSYFQEKEYALAVLNYEKALVINPNNKLAAANSVFVQEKVPNAVKQVDQTLMIKWWQQLVHLFSANVWGIILILFVSATCYLIFHIYQKRIPYAGRWLMLAGLSLILFSSLTYAAYQQFVNPDKGVVMSDQVAFWSAGDATAKQLSKLPKATLVKIKAENKQYNRFFVSLANGQRGWIDAKDLEMVTLNMVKSK